MIALVVIALAIYRDTQAMRWAAEQDAKVEGLTELHDPRAVIARLDSLQSFDEWKRTRR